MLIQPIEVSAWKANCYVVWSGEDAQECVVVDPGITAFNAVTEVLAARPTKVAAILATHGHLDHVGDAHLLAAAHGAPVYLAGADQHLLTRPGDGLGPNGAAMMRQYTGGETLPAIDDVRDYPEELSVAGLTVSAFDAPGHTPGSRLLTVDAGGSHVVFSGDVLFAGTIGRTDLPGGSMAQMRDTLRRIVEGFPEDTALLPGHGQPTVLGNELASNPFLQPDQL